jgi:hypothetical protein
MLKKISTFFIAVMFLFSFGCASPRISMTIDPSTGIKTISIQGYAVVKDDSNKIITLAPKAWYDFGFLDSIIKAMGSLVNINNLTKTIK